MTKTRFVFYFFQLVHLKEEVKTKRVLIILAFCNN